MRLVLALGWGVFSSSTLAFAPLSYNWFPLERGPFKHGSAPRTSPRRRQNAEVTRHMDHNTLHAAVVSPLESSSLTMALDAPDPFLIFLIAMYGSIILIMRPDLREELPSPMKAISETGRALSKLKPMLGPGTATIRIRVALDIPNRHDPQSLPSTLCRILPTSLPRVTLKQTLSTRYPTGKSEESLAASVVSELLQCASYVYAASGECIYDKSDRKAQLQFLQLSVDECQKHIALSEESVGRNGRETKVVVSLVCSTTNPDWPFKARQIRTLDDLQNILLEIMVEANEKEDSVRSTVLLTPTTEGNTTISQLDVSYHFPDLKSFV
jgi:hypothetical protein